ncbi:MAG TPA: efflux RND transporter periplasmic adaptor subunit [Spirochaetia bacterium]
MKARKVCALALLPIVLGSCGRSADPRASGPESPAAQVKLIVAKKEPLTPELSSFGSISYRSKADIATTVDGTVKKLAVDEGDHVRAGQVIAELDNVQLTIRKTQAESQLASAKAAVELARAQLWEGQKQVEARLLTLRKTQLDIDQKKREVDELQATLDNREKLFTVGGISEEQLQSLRLQYRSAETTYQSLLADYAINSIGLRDEDIRSMGLAVPAREPERTAVLVKINTQTLQAQLDAALASLQTATSDLEAARAVAAELVIHSPVNGIIGARQAGVGERLRTGDKVFTIIDDAQVYAVFLVAESKAMGLSEGMPVQVEVPAQQNRVYRSTISIISPLLDPQSGNLTIRALLSNRDGALKPGLFIRVKVRTAQTRQAILLPGSALVGRNGSQASVFVVKGGRSFKQAIVIRTETADEAGGRVEIASGVAPGDRIVDEPSPVLQDGGEVRASD